MNRREDDYCDLDPTKVCDNCCKCLDRDADYSSVLADFLIEGEGEEGFSISQEPLFEDDFGAGNIPPLDIDPKLLAEWEEKLKDIK